MDMDEYDLGALYRKAIDARTISKQPVTVDLDAMLNNALDRSHPERAETAGTEYVKWCVEKREYARLSDTAKNYGLTQKVRDAAIVGHFGIIIELAKEDSGNGSVHLTKVYDIALGVNGHSRFLIHASSDIIEQVSKAAAHAYVEICIKKEYFGLIQLYVFRYDHNGKIFSEDDREKANSAYMERTGKRFTRGPLQATVWRYETAPMVPGKKFCDSPPQSPGRRAGLYQR